jgi:hypothetical protein
MKNIKSFIRGFNIEPVTSTGIDAEGDIEVYSNGLRIYLQAAVRTIVTTDQIQTLTNKTMSGSSNTFSNIPYSALILTDSIVNADINSAAAIAYSKLALSNSIVNADINSSAAIDFSKLAALSSGNILVGSAGNVATSVAMSGESTIANTGAVTLANSAVIGKVLTGFVAGAGTVAATDTILQAFQKLAASVAAGDVTLTAFGATPNANAASLSGQALTLQPADATNPGGVSTTTQTFAGDKTFNDVLINAGEIYWEQENSSVSGANATLATPTKPIVVLQNGALTSIDGLTATADPQIVIISNSSGNPVTINNNTGATAENRIITGTGAALVLQHQASIFLYYSIDAEKWYVIGGSGGMAIGSAITGATANRLLFSDASGDLANSSVLIYEESLQTLTINSVGSSGGESALQVTRTESAGAGGVGGIKSDFIQNSTVTGMGAIIAASTSNINNADVNGIVVNVNSAGFTGVDATGIKILTANNDYDNYYGLYIAGVASGTVTGNNHALHVVAGTSYFGGSLQIKETGGGSDVITVTTPALAASYTLTLPVDGGTAGYVLSTNGSGTTSWIAPGGGGGSGEVVSFDVLQVAHGFAVLDAIRHNGTDWVKAQANADSTLAQYVVTAVADADNFTASNFGKVTATAHGKTLGEYYFLSTSSAGANTSTTPVSGYNQPLFFVEDANTLHLMVQRGVSTELLTGSGGGSTTVTPGAYPYSATNNTTILVDSSSARTINLPAPTLSARITIKDAGGLAATNNITVARNASEQIEGVAASYLIQGDWACITLTSNGTNWFIVD